MIKHRWYVGNIKNVYNNLTKNYAIEILWRDYQAELVRNKKNVPGTVSKLFQNKRFKMPTGTLPGTCDKDGRGENLNTNENMDNV